MENYPYTLDLNTFVKRSLINKDKNAYFGSDTIYFCFGSYEFEI